MRHPAHLTPCLAAVLWTLAACAPTDPGLGSGDDDDDTYAQQPSGPAAMQLAIEPAEPTSVDALTLQVLLEANDADGTVEETRFAWYLDDVEQPDLAGMMTVAAELTSRGQLWRAEGVAIDNDGLSSPTATASATILNSPPSAPGLVITPAGPVGGADALTCLVDTPSFDADDDDVTYAVSWQVDGVDYPGKSALGPTTTELTDDTVPAEDTEPAQVWSCRVTPADAEGVGEVGVVEVTTGVLGPMPDWTLVDVNETSPSFDDPVSPRDYLAKVSGWYFGHAT